MPLPLTISCFSKIQIGFTFLVPAHLGSPGKGPLNGCVCMCVVKKFHLCIAALKYWWKHNSVQTASVCLSRTYRRCLALHRHEQPINKAVASSTLHRRLENRILLTFSCVLCLQRVFEFYEQCLFSETPVVIFLIYAVSSWLGISALWQSTGLKLSLCLDYCSRIKNLWMYYFCM